MWNTQDRETWNVEPRIQRPGMLTPGCGAGLGGPPAGHAGPRQSRPSALVQPCRSKEPVPAVRFPAGVAQPRCAGAAGAPGGQTQGMGTAFFYHFLFQLILSVPSHLFKALGDQASIK